MKQDMRFCILLAIVCTLALAFLLLLWGDKFCFLAHGATYLT